MLLEGDPLPHFHGRGAMIQACEQQFHGTDGPQSDVRRPGERRASENGQGHQRGFSSAPASGGAEHDHEQASAQVKKERRIFGSASQRVPDSVDAQVIAKTTPERQQHEAEIHRRADHVIERRQRRKFFEPALACLFFRRRSCTR